VTVAWTTVILIQKNKSIVYSGFVFFWYKLKYMFLHVRTTQRIFLSIFFSYFFFVFLRINLSQVLTQLNVILLKKQYAVSSQLTTKTAKNGILILSCWFIEMNYSSLTSCSLACHLKSLLYLYHTQRKNSFLWCILLVNQTLNWDFG